MVICGYNMLKFIADAIFVDFGSENGRSIKFKIFIDSHWAS